MLRRFALVVGLASSLSTLACGGGGGSTLSASCTPGVSQACVCPGGTAGVEVCSSVGDFLPCICTGLDAGTELDAFAKRDSASVHPGDAACACDSPPAPTCLDTSTLLVSALPATCADGICAYTEQHVACSEGCSAGACSSASACAGVTCDSPPPPTCSGDSLQTFAAPGTCSGGICSYPSSTESCPSGCSGGACQGDPCAGVTCDDPPSPTCLDDGVTLETYADEGACSAGSCTYGSSDSVCQFGCEDGACENDPCADVTCDSPPPPACVSGTELETYAAEGTCTNGTCSYGTSETTCTTSVAHATATCASGACTFVCQSGYFMSGDQCMTSGTSTPPADLSGMWTGETHSCGGETLPFEGWDTTFTFAAGSVISDSEFTGGCTMDTDFSGVTFTASTITYTSGSTVCGSACTAEYGCVAGSFAGGSMSYTVSGTTLTVTLSDASLCDSGATTLTMMME